MDKLEISEKITVVTVTGAVIITQKLMVTDVWDPVSPLHSVRDHATPFDGSGLAATCGAARPVPYETLANIGVEKGTRRREYGPSSKYGSAFSNL